MRVFFSVGEPSGDLHGANLVRQLRGQNPAVECVGYGGPQMAAAGCLLHTDLTQLALMWFLRVFLNLHHFYRLYRQADSYFRNHRPDAVVLIDYPGFNWWVARAAKRYGIPVFYYGVPQMWAWAGWRVKKMRKLVDHALCKLPFEVAWFSERGCRATYVGHPYFDEVVQRQLDANFVRQMRQGNPLVTILPGSRTQEVLSNLPMFLQAAAHIQQRIPHARLAIASFNERQAEIAREMVAKTGLPIQVCVARTPELIEAAHCCIACSGSVSLELLYHEKPTVIVYRVSRLVYWGQFLFRKVKYITLVNLLSTADLFPEKITVYDPDDPQAEQVPFPEYLTCEDKSPQIAAHIVEWLNDRMAYQLRIAPLRILKLKYAQPGASAKAAQYILHLLEERRGGSTPNRTAA
jgi:lipid-A-disaccharide synthase